LFESCDAIRNDTACASAETKRAHLTTPEVSSAAAGDASIASLVQECQRLMGGVITQADTNILVSMYVADGMPVDMILLGVAHFAAQGKRSARYVERALLGWQRDGIDSGAAAEQYLKQLEHRRECEQCAAKLFEIADGKLPKADSNLVCEWFDGFGYDDAMISEAIAYAGEHKTVKYVNGILRRWHGKGYKTVRDVMQESAGTMQNMQVSNPDAKTVLDGGMKRVPVFHAGGDAK
ncbi:MAG: DnaD domain protein, partial [Ruthenibacterium sp.]